MNRRGGEPVLITVNGEKLDETVRTDSLRALLDDIAPYLPKHEIIVSVDLNGSRIGEAELPTTLENPVAENMQIDLATSPREMVVADALHALADELTAAAEDQRAAADDLDGGQSGAALASIGEFVKTWKACQDAIAQSSALLSRDLTAFVYEGKPVADHLQGLCEKLTVLRDALSAKDAVSLADTLHFDIPEECATWCGLLRALAADLQDVPASSHS